MIRYVVTFAALLLCPNASAQNSLLPIRPSGPLVFFIPTESIFPGQGFDYGIYIQLKPDGTSVRLEVSEDGPPAVCTGTYELTPNFFADTVKACGRDMDKLKPADVTVITLLTTGIPTFPDFFAHATLGTVRPIRPSDPSLPVEISVRVEGEVRVTEMRRMTVFEGELPK